MCIPREQLCDWNVYNLLILLFLLGMMLPIKMGQYCANLIKQPLYFATIDFLYIFVK